MEGESQGDLVGKNESYIVKKLCQKEVLEREKRRENLKYKENVTS